MGELLVDKIPQYETLLYMKKIKFKKPYFIVFVLLIVVLAVIYILRSINSSSVGTIESTNTSNTKLTQPSILLKKVSNKYASFSYPSYLLIYPSNKAVYPTLLDYNYINHGFSSSYISISILDIPGGSLSSNNAYQTRQLDPNIYKEKDLKVNGQGVITFSSQDESGYSEIAFLVSPNYQASISLSNAAGQQDSQSQAALVDILKSWHWN
jgi:hypothetical protein